MNLDFFSTTAIGMPSCIFQVQLCSLLPVCIKRPFYPIEHGICSNGCLGWIISELCPFSVNGSHIGHRLENKHFPGCGFW